MQVCACSVHSRVVYHTSFTVLHCRHSLTLCYTILYTMIHYLALLQSPVQLTPWRKGRFNPCWGRKTPGHGEKISQVFPSYYSYVDPVAKWKIHCTLLPIGVYTINIVNKKLYCAVRRCRRLLLPPAATLPSAVASIHCRFLLLLVLCTVVPGWCCHPLPFIPTMYANPTLQNKHPPVRPPNGI